MEFTLTSAVIDGWKREQKQALDRAEKAKAEAALLARKIEAAELLMSAPDSNGAVTPPRVEASADDNMTAAIEAIAKTVSTPITYDEMKKELRKLGFPNDRLANYYYTAVNRLALKGRITLDDDKRIGPAAGVLQ